MENRHHTVSGNVVDLLSRRIFPGKVEVCNGKIVSVEEIAQADGAGYILPGFVDSHIHIESTLMVPHSYARMAVANGVVAAVCDPHEIANVLGMDGVGYMIEDGKSALFNFYFAAPSCVPSTPFETAGAELGADDVAQLLGKDEVVALAEMMNVPGVVYEDPQVMSKLQAAKDAGKPVDGHAPKTGGEMLQKYIAAGISTDHECSTLEEAREKIALGMKVLVREGSAACDFETLYPLIAESPGMAMFCSDDMYPDDVRQIGYINGMVRRAVAKGMPLWETLECASVTPVKHYGLKSGLLQAGDQADFIVVDNLQQFNILSTYVQGEEVYNSNVGVTENLRRKKEDVLPDNLNKFYASQVSAKSLQVAWRESGMKVIVANEGSLLTGTNLIRPQKDAVGNVVTDVQGGISKIVVYSRYAPSEPQVAYIKGFGLKQGAIASTIAHDSHNIIAVGSNDEDLARAINALVVEKGGIVVCNGEEVECLPLPVAGLMTMLVPEEVADRHRVLRRMAARMGCPIKAPFMTLAFMALPVIPDLKLTDKGLFDGVKFEFTSVWSEK